MKLFLGILVAAGMTIGFVQQQRIAGVRTDLESQQGATAEARRLRTENNTTQRAQISAEEIESMRADRIELMRLRAGMADLRIAARSPDELNAEISKLNKAAAADEETARTLNAAHQASEYSKEARNVLQGVGVLIRVAAGQGKGKPPRSFQDIETMIGSMKVFSGTDELRDKLSKGAPPFHITKDQFEFLPEGASPGGALLMRERQPRELPDGTWARYYLKTDYSVNEVNLKDGNFAGWEQENFN